MATVERKVTPGKTDPFGTGKILVTDCLDKFSQQQSDPFLLLHHFGPAHITAMPQFGMHPHRGVYSGVLVSRARHRRDSRDRSVIFSHAVQRVPVP